jgi:MYB-related transcription factor LHY
VEGLRLYGRGWRHIAQFIGTKTAVQIRSHAQKFFSKVEKGQVVDEGELSTGASFQNVPVPEGGLTGPHTTHVLLERSQPR